MSGISLIFPHAQYALLTVVLEYNIKADPRFPVVNVGNKENPSYLPAEVCQVEPGQPAGAKLAPNQTRNMLNFAVRGPAENARSIVAKGPETLSLSPPNETLVRTVLLHGTYWIAGKECG